MTNQEVEEQVKGHLQEIAKVLQGMLPEDYGFIFMTYKHNSHGQLMYVSNSAREDVVKCLKEFIEKTENTYGNDTGKY